jgi:hypothetical protein
MIRMTQMRTTIKNSSTGCFKSSDSKIRMAYTFIGTSNSNQQQPPQQRRGLYTYATKDFHEGDTLFAVPLSTTLVIEEIARRVAGRSDSSIGMIHSLAELHHFDLHLEELHNNLPPGWSSRVESRSLTLVKESYPDCPLLKRNWKPPV